MSAEKVQKGIELTVVFYGFGDVVDSSNKVRNGSSGADSGTVDGRRCLFSPRKSIFVSKGVVK